jgi:hypothetical protein
LKNAEEYLDIIFFRSINIVIRFVRNRKLLGMMGERTKEQDGGRVLGKSLTFPLDGAGGFSTLCSFGSPFSTSRFAHDALEGQHGDGCPPDLNLV